MARQIMHRGKRSWWNGTVTTLCGLTLPGNTTEGVWFPALSGHKPCPACETVHNRQRR
ncbi:hypothetical protein [Saccharothrix sp. NRRL B-16314]|uniref:hypothetical protein n=1 Tax=Saccharothrix sp. NRRL B-16314 TaxID=1463825 RepID=UPI000B12118A|nr:hypothetical protein [Saccharothrix sp. NRRL B-16314]